MNGLFTGLKAETPSERFWLPGCEIKGLDQSRREFEIWSSSGALDHCREVVPRRALEGRIDEYRANPLVTYCHQFVTPIGKCLEVGFDGHDRFGGRCKVSENRSKAHTLADIAWDLISEGIVQQASIGYKSYAGHVEPWTDGQPAYWHDDIRVFEQSVVPIGMNEDTLVLAKALGMNVTPLMGLEVKGATKFADLPLAEEGKAWDARGADNRLRAWAGGEGVNFGQYAKGFFWMDPEKKDQFAGYKLGFADVVDGELQAVWRGCAAAMGALLGARGGVDIPDDDRQPVYKHIGRYYQKFEKDKPEFKGLEVGAWLEAGNPWPEFKEITWHNDEPDLFAEAELQENVALLETQATALKGIAESTRNGFRHLLKGASPIAFKDGRVLSASNLEKLVSARDMVDEVVRAHQSSREGKLLGDPSEAQLAALLAEQNRLLAEQARLRGGL